MALELKKKQRLNVIYGLMEKRNNMRLRYVFSSANKIPSLTILL
jgi:hypothetical protein